MLLSVRLLLPFIKAIGKPNAEYITMAVCSSILSIIVLDATLMCSYASFT